MANKKGGYQIVEVATLTYALALLYLDCGKPLLVIDGTNHPFFADSVVKDESDNVVIQKGGYTITIEEDDTITTDGVIPISGGGGGVDLYVTTIDFSKTSAQIIGTLVATLYSTSAINNKTELKTYLNAYGLGTNKEIMASGYVKDQASDQIYVSSIGITSDKIYAFGADTGIYEKDSYDIDEFDATFSSIKLQ